MKTIILFLFILCGVAGCICTDAKPSYPGIVTQVSDTRYGSVFSLKYDGEEYILYQSRRGCAITKK